MRLGGGLHNARPCPSLASCPTSRRPRPRLAKDLSLSSDWLLAPTEVRAVSHTSLHVDLGAGAGLKGLSQPMGSGRLTQRIMNGKRGDGSYPFSGKGLRLRGRSGESCFLNCAALRNETPVLEQLNEMSGAHGRWERKT